MRRLILILLVCAAQLAVQAVVAAQSVVTIAPQQCVWHAGDSAAWTAPALNEADWQPLATWKRQTSEPRFWIRCSADLSTLRSLAHPALQVAFYDAYQLYLDGAPIGNAGNFEHGSFDLDAIRTFPIAAGQVHSGPATVALRVANRVLLTNSGPINGVITGSFELRAGDASILDALRARAVLTKSSHYFGSAACFSIVGVLAMMLIFLYVYDRSRSEFLLLSVTCLSLTALRLNELATAAYLPYSIAACLFVVLVGNIALTSTQYPFFFALVNRRPGRLIWTIIIINCCCYWPNAIDVFITSSSPGWLSTVSLMFIRPLSLFLHIVLTCSVFVAFWPYREIPRRVRPLALLCMLWMTADLLWFLAEATAIPIPGIPNIFQTWGVPLIEVRAFTTAGVITALLGLLFREQRRNALERAALTAELEAARTVQKVLIPDEVPSIPGYAAETVYLPASQVGGDFFQIVATQHGGAFIVIGDVSGKGMPAAMTVSLLVGTVRTLAHYTQNPGEILAAMNQRMLARSQGGFTTCLVLRTDADGTLTAANAGHLMPYIDGVELAVESGLPLGLAAHSTYPEIQFRMLPGQQLTLLTDGVVEARKPAGELFGFERTAAISTKSAQEIAHSAQHFGQEDDITVLTLTLIPAGALNA